MTFRVTCPDCGGFGETSELDVRWTSDGPEGGYIASRCEACDGKGTITPICEGYHPQGQYVDAVGGIEGQYLCAQCAEDSDIILAPVRVTDLGEGWSRAAA